MGNTHLRIPPWACRNRPILFCSRHRPAMTAMNFLRTTVATTVLALVFLIPNTSQASSDALLDLLVKKKLITQQEADQLREELKKEDAKTVEQNDKTKVSSWISEMKWSGDLRLRYEFIDNSDQASKIDRTRFRFRLRFGLET